MRPKLASVTDEFRKIVQSVSSGILIELKAKDTKITGVHFEHGHPLEVIETMKQLSQGSSTKLSRYPLIALFQPFEEVATKDNTQVTLHIIIAAITNPEWKAEKRKIENFDPILYPIYQDFMKEISYSSMFNILDMDKVEKTKIDQYAWGRDGLYGMEGNIFNDHLDIIEIKNFKLKINTGC